MALELVTDVSNPAQIRATAARASSELGNISVLTNNAAVVGPLGATSQLDPVEVSRSLAVNVVAVITLTAAVIPAMTAAGWGRVINVSSGIVSTPGMMIGGTIYAASKAAIEWIRDQPPERIGIALHQRFTANYTEGNHITPHQSAAALLSRLSTEDTGQIWNVDDDGRS